MMEASTTWAEEAFGAAALGDVRRTARLVQLAAALGAQPQAALPQAIEEPALRKAAYRFCGCRIEQRQFGTAYRLTTCLTLSSVLAWRHRFPFPDLLKPG